MQDWMINLMLVVQVVAALTMIGLVLIQHGKGADMGASFGGGASGSLFGATGSANFLSRSTAACATVFFAATLALAFMSNAGTARVQGASVLDRPASAASAPDGTVAPGAIPGAVPMAVPAVPAPVPMAAPAGVPQAASAPAPTTKP